MRQTLDPAAIAARAEAAARDSAVLSGVEISDVHETADIRSVCRLFNEVWGTGTDDSLLQPGMLRAMVHAGNYAAGAFANGEMVGAVMGFLGRDDDGPYLHSHILGVSDTYRGQSVGFALKQHQRSWTLERGMRKVTRTFDPLVRKNAHFNVQKLGATADTYLEKFYGSMTDEINAGDETDRLLVVWRLDDPQAELAASERRSEPEVDTSAKVALSPSQEVDAANWGRTVLCATPDDIVALRKTDGDGALRWRRALRDTLGSALAHGYRVTGFTRTGWYILERA